MGKGLHLVFQPPVTTETPVWTDGEDLTGNLNVKLNRAGYVGADRGPTSGFYTESSMSYHGAATVGNPQLKKARIHDVPFPDALFGSPESAGSGFAQAYAAASGGSMAAVGGEVAADISAGGFTNPLSIAGCMAWYRMGFGIVGNPSVTQWTDQTGNGRHANSLYTASPQRQIDGSILFNGVDQAIGTFASFAQPLTIVMQAKLISVGPPQSFLGGYSNLVMGAIINVAGTNCVQLYAGGSFAADNPDMALTGTWGTWTLWFAGASSATQLDHDPFVGTVNAGTDGFDSLYFGSCPAQGGYTNIQIAEIAVYDSIVFGPDHDDLIDYMAALT